MNKCKRNEEGHVFRLDVPHFFNREDLSVVEHYTNAINSRLEGEHDPFWRHWTPEVFVHLQCQYCGAEEHTYFPINYLRTVMDDPDFGMKMKSFTRLQYKIGDELMMDHTIELSPQG